MIAHLPQRPSQHQLSDKSVNFFRSHLPKEWTCEESKSDYGADLRVGIACQGYVTGEAFTVQMKASAEAPLGDSVTVELAVSTLNYLRNLLDVVLIVKFVESEGEAYWLLLKDFEAQAGEGQQTISIHIPRQNRVTQEPWNRIAAHVHAVHMRKLAANARGPWKEKG